MHQYLLSNDPWHVGHVVKFWSDGDRRVECRECLVMLFDQQLKYI